MPIATRRTICGRQSPDARKLFFFVPSKTWYSFPSPDFPFHHFPLLLPLTSHLSLALESWISSLSQISSPCFTQQLSHLFTNLQHDCPVRRTHRCHCRGLQRPQCHTSWGHHTLVGFSSKPQKALGDRYAMERCLSRMHSAFDREMALPTQSGTCPRYRPPY